MLIDISSVYIHLQEDWEERFRNVSRNEALSDLKNLGMPFEKFSFRFLPRKQDKLKGTKCKYVYLDYQTIAKTQEYTDISITTRYLYDDGDEIISMRYFYQINKDGTFKYRLKNGNQVFFSYELLTDLIPQGEQVSLQENGLVYISFFALQLMNCKNVELQEVDPNTTVEITRQQRRFRERKGLEPLKKYHVLNIKPFNSKKYSNKENFTESKVSLHICRGHFKTYTGKGLFGKYNGTYWFPSHVKGNRMNGEVEKDYKLTI